MMSSPKCSSLVLFVALESQDAVKVLRIVFLKTSMCMLIEDPVRCDPPVFS